MAVKISTTDYKVTLLTDPDFSRWSFNEVRDWEGLIPVERQLGTFMRARFLLTGSPDASDDSLKPAVMAVRSIPNLEIWLTLGSQYPVYLSPRERIAFVSVLERLPQDSVAELHRTTVEEISANLERVLGPIMSQAGFSGRNLSWIRELGAEMRVIQRLSARPYYSGFSIVVDLFVPRISQICKETIDGIQLTYPPVLSFSARILEDGESTAGMKQKPMEGWQWPFTTLGHEQTYTSDAVSLVESVVIPSMNELRSIASIHLFLVSHAGQFAFSDYRSMRYAAVHALAGDLVRAKSLLSSFAGHSFPKDVATATEVAAALGLENF